MISDAVRNLLDAIAKRCPGLVNQTLLIESLPDLVRDRSVRNAVWDCLVAWDGHVKSMPDGPDKECHEELLRFAKGQIKSWRWWFLRERIGQAEGPEKAGLQQQLSEARMKFRKKVKTRR